MRFWLPLYPDVSHPIGGVKQVHRLAEILHNLGYEATVVQDNASFHPSWFESNVKTISLSSLQVLPGLKYHSDYFIIPETFITLLPQFFKGFPKIIFNQNSSYSFGMPGSSYDSSDVSHIVDLYHHPDVKHILCVSDYDYGFLVDCIGLSRCRVSKIVNAFENKLFTIGDSKGRIISYMPRKNREHSSIVTQILRTSPDFQRLEWRFLPLHGLSHHRIADALKASSVFLSFGHPEGFGLPLVEAGACGCVIIGYTGIGGSEIFSLGSDFNMAYPIMFGDYHSFITTTLNTIHQLHNHPLKYSRSAISFSQALAGKYSPDAMQQSVKSFLGALASL